MLDDMGNLPAIEVDATRIRGTDASVEIRYVFGEPLFTCRHHCRCQPAAGKVQVFRGERMYILKLFGMDMSIQ